MRPQILARLASDGPPGDGWKRFDLCLYGERKMVVEAASLLDAWLWAEELFGPRATARRSVG